MRRMRQGDCQTETFRNRYIPYVCGKSARGTGRWGIETTVGDCKKAQPAQPFDVGSRRNARAPRQ